MKAWTSHLVLLASLAPCVSALAQPAPAPVAQDKSLPQRAAVVKYVLIMPNDKTSETVKPEDRNPFGHMEDDSKQYKGSSEEVMIRDRLMKLRVCGASLDEKGEVSRVMLGDMILTPGQGLPAVVQNQTLALRVGSMTKTAIELIWIEKKPLGLPARTLAVPVDLRPFVRYRLLGQEPGAAGKNGKGSKSNANSMGLQFTAELSNVPVDAIPASLKNHLPGLPETNGEAPGPEATAKEAPPADDAAKPDALKQALNLPGPQNSVTALPKP